MFSSSSSTFGTLCDGAEIASNILSFFRMLSFVDLISARVMSDSTIASLFFHCTLRRESLMSPNTAPPLSIVSSTFFCSAGWMRPRISPIASLAFLKLDDTFSFRPSFATSVKKRFTPRPPRDAAAMISAPSKPPAC